MEPIDIPLIASQCGLIAVRSDAMCLWALFRGPPMDGPAGVIRDEDLLDKTWSERAYFIVRLMREAAGEMGALYTLADEARFAKPGGEG